LSNSTFVFFMPILPESEVIDYVSLCICFVTFIVSIISFLIFIDFKENLFVYLKIGQLWIILAMVINILYSIFWINSDLEKTIVWPIYFKFFFVYFTSTCELCAFGCTILSAFSFLSMIDKKWDFIVFKISPYYVVSGMAIISLALFSFQIFQFDINYISNSVFVSPNHEIMNLKIFPPF